MIAADIKRIKGRYSIFLLIKLFFSTKGFQGVALYRISNFCFKKKFSLLAIIIKNFNIAINGCDIGEECFIGEGLMLGHPVGVVIASGSKIGKNVTFMSSVVLGSKNGLPEYPIIKDNVYVGTGAKILGNITIGNNVTIGANSVVINDIPDNCIVVGIPGKVVKNKNLNKEI